VFWAETSQRIGKFVSNEDAIEGGIIDELSNGAGSGFHLARANSTRALSVDHDVPRYRHQPATNRAVLPLCLLKYLRMAPRPEQCLLHDVLGTTGVASQ